MMTLALLYLAGTGLEAGGAAAPGAPAPPANRLAQEKSPYLRQHAHNPVYWYPWGPEALARAEREDRPVFLSIGYSTCHWCHVMAHESFADEGIAKLLNERFVPIKIDREERPDLDHLYMLAVQAMTGSGGWPLTVFLTPRREPFFGGTYFPPEDRWGRPGLRSLLERIAEAWPRDRDAIESSAAQMGEFLRRHEATATSATGGALPKAATLDRAWASLQARHDATHGGFGGAPKFPTGHTLAFLLRYAARTGNPEALAVARRTLDAIGAGGIHDHLGGGFHRYATDEQWRIPHFEKMLYDQAQLARAYTDAWRLTGDDAYATTARRTLDYVLRDLTDPEGGFYSAEDADSEGREGTFYLWDADEIDRLLGAPRAAAFRHAFGVTPAGNWEGRNILHRAAVRPPLPAQLVAAREELRQARARRIRPHRDEKIIVAWNGLMIEALAEAGRAWGEARYLTAARRAAAFIDEHLWNEGRLLRHYHQGPAAIPGYLDDYAFLGGGLLALYEATFDLAYLDRARHVAAQLGRLFERPTGGFDFSAREAEELIAPVVEVDDGALPSGNAAAALFLLRLGHLTADVELEDRGRAVLAALASHLEAQPAQQTALLAALDLALGPVTEIVIAGRRGEATTEALLARVGRSYLPNGVLAFHPQDDPSAAMARIPYLAAQPAGEGGASASVCRDYACQLPVQTEEALGRLLAKAGGPGATDSGVGR